MRGSAREAPASGEAGHSGAGAEGAGPGEGGCRALSCARSTCARGSFVFVSSGRPAAARARPRRLSPARGRRAAALARRWRGPWRPARGAVRPPPSRLPWWDKWRCRGGAVAGEGLCQRALSRPLTRGWAPPLAAGTHPPRAEAAGRRGPTTHSGGSAETMREAGVESRGREGVWGVHRRRRDGTVRGRWPRRRGSRRSLGLGHGWGGTCSGRSLVGWVWKADPAPLPSCRCSTVLGGRKGHCFEWERDYSGEWVVARRSTSSAIVAPS